MPQNGNAKSLDNNEAVETVTRKDTFIERQLNDISSCNFWRAFFAEYVGTFILCLYTIGYGMYMPDDGSPPDLLGVAVSSGFIVAVLIIALLTVSGGHVNPAISIGFFVNGQITFVRFICYIISHCIASVSAVLVLKYVTPSEMHGSLGLILPGSGVTPAQALVVEFLIDFVLLFGTFAVIDDRRTDNTQPNTIFVGFIVAANVFFAGRISGGCMNPARNFGPAVITGNLAIQWVYWIGPLLGGAVGALTYTQIFSVQAIEGCSFSLCRRRKSTRNKNPNTESSQETENML